MHLFRVFPVELDRLGVALGTIQGLTVEIDDHRPRDRGAVEGCTFTQPKESLWT